MTTAQQQTNGTVKSDQTMDAFTITERASQFVVTCDGEWIGTFSTSYRARLHIACIAA
jgi:hypothetical protein